MARILVQVKTPDDGPVPADSVVHFVGQDVHGLVPLDAAGSGESEDVPAGDYELWPIVTGYRIEPAKAAVPAPEPIPLPVREGCSLAGVVHGSDNQPLAGAEVRCFGPQPLDMHRTRGREDGSFRLGGLAGEGGVVFLAPDHAALVLPLEHMPRDDDGNFQVSVSLPVGVTYHGLVQDADGRPVVDEVVRRVKDPGVPLPFPLPETRTRSEGRFVLRHAPIGPMRLQIGDQAAPVQGADGETVEINLRLAP